MSGCAVDVEAPGGLREAVGAWLVGATGQAIEERADGVLVGFLESEAELGKLRRAAQEAFGEVVRMAGRPLEPVDWSERWREGLGARRFGRLVVAPSWIAVAPEPGTVALVLDPETAFGSGEHGSTRAALLLLEQAVRPGDRVLDLGSGSGILAIAAALLGAAQATGIEVDEEANPVAERNARRNGVADRVRFLEGEAGALAPLLGPADIVLSNILRTVNLTLLDAIGRALRPGGLAIFAGMETPEAELFRPDLTAAGFRVEAEREDSGWWAVGARHG